MTRVRGWRVLGGVAFVTVAALTSLALGDERSEARRHFESGMAMIRNGRYLPGIAELERANTILPHPSVRYNIARAYADAGLLEEAVASYQGYLAREPEDQRGILLELRELEARLAAEKKTTANARNAAPCQAPPTPSAPEESPGARGDDESSPREGAYREEVVTASRTLESPLDAPNSTTIITRQDIYLSGITRIPELLRRVAGMDVMQITGGDANVSMRGLNGRLSNKVLVLVNGNIVKNDLLGATFWESLTIDVDQLERIEIVRGPGSSLYGADALGGVINIITIAPGEGASGGRAGIGDGGQGYGSVWASQRRGDFAFRVSSGYTRYPRWTRELAPGRTDVTRADVDPNIGAENLRFDLRTALRVGKERSLELGVGFGRSTLDVYGVGPFNDYAVYADYAEATAAFRSKHLVVRTRYSHLGADAQQSHAHLGHSLYESHPTQRVLDANIELSNAVVGPGSLRHSVLGGVGYRLKKVDWSYLVSPLPIEHHVGAFAQDAVRFGERFGVTASGRLDYVPALRTVVPSARATFLVQPDARGRQAVKASIATAFRSPTFLEAYLDLPVQLQLSGVEVQSSSRRDADPSFRIAPEKILAAELQYQNRSSDDVEFEIAAYYHRISDRIQLAQVRRATLSELAGGVGGLNPETGRYRVGSSGWENSCGVDHVLGGEVGGHYVGVEGLDVFANDAVNYGIRARSGDCADAGDQRTSHHKVNAGAQLRLPSGVNGEVSVHYQTSQSWSEQIASTAGIVDSSFPLPGYQLLNGRVGYAFLRGRRAEVSAVVFNALANVVAPAPQMHPFGNQVGRRLMLFFSYQL